MQQQQQTSHLDSIAHPEPAQRLKLVPGQSWLEPDLPLLQHCQGHRHNRPLTEYEALRSLKSQKCI